ncbi:MAG: hypothetical protein KDA62_04735 [Planctomycetales bacterium]|nr:hypothetical protein [Planctomycetales bacterium]MCA9162257.1 hypothetical protein [Planctomycetales bacterium]
MSKNLTNSLAIALVSTVILAAHANAQSGNLSVASNCGSAVVHAQVTRSTANSVIYKVVQQTPQYNLRRPEVVSGARVTLFANFLRQEPGVVLFNLNGTSTECTLVEWKPNSVTIELPRLGLVEPKNAEIQIVLPDGRIAKNFPVLYVSQPDIVVHEDTIPQPLPPAPATAPAVYASPVQGGLILQASSQ